MRLDNPLVLSILFHPRAEEMGRSRLQNVHDGTIPVEDEAVLGYRLYVDEPDSPVLVYFHGNAEVASDYDDIAPAYHRIGLSLLVVDYRGYGWSTGRPLVSTLLSDVEPVKEALPRILEGARTEDVSLLVMGRSLGSACAIHMAHLYPNLFKGLIIESGFAHTLPLLARLGIPADALADLPDPIGNVREMQTIDLPLLVIHGERDMLIPVANGQALYDASPTRRKYIVRMMRAGHNDLLYYGAGEYFAAIKGFVQEILE